MQHPVTSSCPLPAMPREIRGITHLTVSELVDEIGVCRQTIWRWRKDGSIPQGQKFRDGAVVFSPAEVQAIRAFAEHTEPIPEPADPVQSSLFDRVG
jgi:predicted DNA-binding transcriptional regulator AlpA